MTRHQFTPTRPRSTASGPRARHIHGPLQPMEARRSGRSSLGEDARARLLVAGLTLFAIVLIVALVAQVQP
jgi:hypothetical protein